MCRWIKVLGWRRVASVQVKIFWAAIRKWM